MNKSIVRPAIWTIMAIVICGGCNQHADNSQNMTTNTDTTAMSAPASDSAKLTTDWEKYKIQAQADIQENEDSIHSLRKKTAHTGQKMKAKFNEAIANLERRNDTLKVHLREFRAESKEHFQKFKVDFDNGMDSVKKSLKDLGGKKS